MLHTPAHKTTELTYTPPPITGYRELTKTEVDLMNEVKAHAETTRILIDRVCGHVGDLAATVESGEAMRWLAMARSDLQVGYMKLTRAVARPTTF